MDLGLKDATAVVTGGTEGMGRATADCLAADGARVAVFARQRPRLEETARALERLGSPEAVGLAVDVTDPAAITAAFADLARRWGTLNILVNTVGPNAGGTIDQLDDDGWARAFELGTMSAVRCVR